VPYEVCQAALTDRGLLTCRHWTRTSDKKRTITICFTSGTVAPSRVLRTALVPYGNMDTSKPHSFETSEVITMKLCTFDYVRETNTFAKFG